MRDRLRRLDRNAFYARLDAERQVRGLTWGEVAAEVHVSPSTLTRLAQGNTPEADALISLLAWLRESDLAPYIIDGRTPLGICRDVNLAWGHICGLALHHRGAHQQDLGTAIVSWGSGLSAGGRT